MRKFIVIGLLAFALVAWFAVNHRHAIIVSLTTPGEEPQLIEDAKVIAGAVPFGDEEYYTVVSLDPQTFAISEPHYWARNISYLIVGNERALLFDSGPGHRDIRPVVESLTHLPVTFLPSHFHYDHTGREGSFDRIAVVDLPHIRDQARGNELTLSWEQHLGSAEGIETPTLTIDEWIKPGQVIDLGQRRLLLLYTPGHTDNSVSLYDADRQIMFSGDFVSGPLAGALTPTSNLGDYLQTTERVLESTNSRTTIHGAHGPEDGTMPSNNHDDLTDLRATLIKVREGEIKGTGTYPVIYSVNERMILAAEPRWLQKWTPTYPDN